MDQKFQTVWEKCQKTAGGFDSHCTIVNCCSLSALGIFYKNTLYKFTLHLP